MQDKLRSPRRSHVAWYDMPPLNLNKSAVNQKDLNKWFPNDDEPNAERYWKRGDNTTSISGDVTCYFQDIEKHLIDVIGRYNYAVGCVAWLTNRNILEALANLKGVQLLVQKEDFLRPDVAEKRQGQVKGIRELYDNLSPLPDRYFINPYLNYNRLWDSAPPVLCVGNHNADKSPAHPRMHNKFLVVGELCERIDGKYHDEYFFVPQGVWTGSFNFTQNATYSFENAIFTTDTNIVNAYYDEYRAIFAFGEDLDWTSRWSAPKYRIGT